MSLCKARILVVEDHAATARGLKMFLEVSGHTVHVARDVATALAMSAAVEFDILVCDLTLPDGTGWELMETLCEDRAICAIAFSGLHERADIERSRRAGFVEHVVKGSTAEDLLGAIERAMKGASSSRAQPNALA